MRTVSGMRRILQATQVAARQAAMLFANRAIILLYHRVAEGHPDPHLLCVSPQHFAEQLQVLRRWGRPVAVRDLNAGLRSGSIPAHGFALTFDDGYADNLTLALPLLEQAQVPATVYASGGHVQSGGELYIDELQHAILTRRDLPVEFGLHIGRTEYRWSAAPPGKAHPATAENLAWPDLAREHIYLEVCQLLRPLNAAERGHALEELRAQLGERPVACNQHRLLARDQLRALDAHPLVEIGSHGLDHLVLANLDREAQAAEMRAGREVLERILERKVESFAYPYGSPWDVGRQTIALARELGLREACANTPGQVVRGSNPYWLPRFLVRDWDGEEFERRLRGFDRPQLAREVARE
jgi:peptidoglycan/xylan/chitin deacetylase (PgdA/CDA1 family)